jgi:hypothetical protein
LTKPSMERLRTYKHMKKGGTGISFQRTCELRELNPEFATGFEKPSPPNGQGAGFIGEARTEIVSGNSSLILVR